MKTSLSLKHLFTSRTRIKLIGILFYFPKEIFYIRQLVRLVNEEINSVRRELSNLKLAGFLSSEWRAHRLFYQANSQSPLFTDLLTLANKSNGLALSIQENLSRLGSVKAVVASLSFLGGDTTQKNHVDLIIVGQVALKEIEKLVKAEEAKRNHEINYMVMEKAEFQLRQHKHDPFLVDFFLAYPIVIFGSLKDIAN